MNSNINNQPKAAKKLALSKETIRQISSMQIKTGPFGPTAECSISCPEATCYSCGCP
jgi:hypothetical protein